VLAKSDAVLAKTPAGFTGSSGNALGSCSVDTDTIHGSAPKPSTTKVQRGQILLCAGIIGCARGNTLAASYAADYSCS